CQIEQHDEEREIHDAERGDGEPIAAARPLDRSASAIGSNSRNPTPNRNTPSVTGSLVPIANRVVPPATPPKALDATAASTPTYSFRKARMGGQERRAGAAVRAVADADRGQSGRLSCFLVGISTRFPRSIASALTMRERVARGMITSSI